MQFTVWEIISKDQSLQQIDKYSQSSKLENFSELHGRLKFMCIDLQVETIFNKTISNILQKIETERGAG